MRGLGWTQLTMNEEIEKVHWEDSKKVNEALITQNKIQIEMAREVIKLCDRRISEFPEEEKDLNKSTTV